MTIKLAAAVASPLKKNLVAVTSKKPTALENAYTFLYAKFVQIRMEELRDAA